ncbi:MAG TPA: pantoate--beta-alanine ligase [Turneriella sp.]|nr:pantoate--beta-alanine ligase [Turneriella sp.]
MKIIKTIREMRAFRPQCTVGFLPTMGYLHEGHLSLVRLAKKENDVVVVSIFVNPAQFNDANDLEKYPTDIERDIQLLERENVDVLFLPTRNEVYPNGIPALSLRYERMMQQLCGAFRPNHFEGVLLIVHNLLLWVAPTRAYFGLKDYQQYLLIKKMSGDLSLAVEIVGAPLVREKDGLAMSSRNVRLTEKGRTEALKISKALFAAKEDVLSGKLSFAQIKDGLWKVLEPLQIEYATLCDADTLEEIVEKRCQSILIAVAAYVDGVRLIDNALILR